MKTNQRYICSNSIYCSFT